MTSWIAENWHTVLLLVLTIWSAYSAHRSANSAKEALKTENKELKSLVAEFSKHTKEQRQFQLLATNVLFAIVEEESTTAANYIKIKNIGGYGHVEIEPQFNMSHALNNNIDIRKGTKVDPGNTYTINISAKDRNPSGYFESRKGANYTISCFCHNGNKATAIVEIDDSGNAFIINK